MAKTWEELSVAERLELLRSDIAKTMDVVNYLSRRVDASGAAFDDLYARLKAVEDRLGQK